MNIREVPFFNKISVNGIAFIIGEDKPFTGKLVCRYPSDILKEEETYKNGIIQSRVTDKNVTPEAFLMPRVFYFGRFDGGNGVGISVNPSKYSRLT